MKKIAILTLTFALNINAYTMTSKNLECSHFEAAKNRPYISMTQAKPVSDLAGKGLVIASAQVAKALEILDVEDITQTEEYTYKLTLFGKKYDAINIDVGGNGRTVVFKEKTSVQMNFAFNDGDLYINDERCYEVELPGTVQF